MRRAFVVLLLAVGCQNRGAVRMTAEGKPPSAEPAEAVREAAPETAPAQAAAPVPRDTGPAIPELDYVAPGPTKDDGLAGSGVPGYKRPGCDPLGPYEDEFFNTPGYDATACAGFARMGNVTIGAIDGRGGGALPSKPKPIRCWPLSEREKARNVAYSRALAEWNACPKQRGGHGVELPEDAPLAAGTCADGTRFLRAGYPTQHLTRFYDGERLVGIRLFRGVGKGGDCRGEVNCEVSQEAGLCGTSLNQPRSYAPHHPSGDDVPAPINEGGSGAASGRSARACPGPVHLRVRNASELDFDSVEVNQIDFGALQRGAQSGYQLATGCVYSYGAMKVTSGKQRFATWPIDFVGERPLQAGYYTHALTVQPGRPGDAGNVNSRISKDPPP